MEVKMRSKCIPFILLLIITIGLASCGKAAGTNSSGSPDTSKASDQTLTEAPDRSAGDNDPEKPNTETYGGSSTDTTASPENYESISLSSTAQDSSLSVSEQSPDQSSAADSTTPSSDAKTDSSKPAEPLSDPDDGTGSEMDHKASRTRPEHTVDDLVYNPPAPQAPASWTAPASQTTNSSDSSSNKQQNKKEKKEKSKKGNRIGSSMGGGSF